MIALFPGLSDEGRVGVAALYTTEWIIKRATGKLFRGEDD